MNIQGGILFRFYLKVQSINETIYLPIFSQVQYLVIVLQQQKTKPYEPDRQEVGICTVLKSSDVSSLLVVPMKSNSKQFKLSCSKCEMRSFCSCLAVPPLNMSLMLLLASLSRLHESVKISRSCVSRNELEILRCLVNERFTSTFFFYISPHSLSFSYLTNQAAITITLTHLVHVVYFNDQFAQQSNANNAQFSRVLNKLGYIGQDFSKRVATVACVFSRHIKPTVFSDFCKQLNQKISF